MSEPETSRASSWLPHLRGVLVAVHVLAVFVLSTPDLGGGLNRKSWKAATVQVEFQAWTDRFNRWGADVSTAQVEQRAWEVANSWVELREKLLTPFRPYHRYIGVRQRWRMFAAPMRQPARIRIAVERDGEWDTVYEARSPEHTWRADQLDRERFRVMINQAAWVHRRALYKKLLRWIVDAAAQDFPDATRVRVSFIRSETLPPDRARAGESTPEKEIRVKVRKLPREVKE